MKSVSFKSLDKLIARHGLETIKGELKKREISRPETQELTIISNQNLHKIPVEQIHGELYVASRGNLRLDDKEVLMRELTDILKKLKKKLHERSWKKIYLHYTGPQILGSAIKYFVYRTIGLETVDFVYINGVYLEIALDYRNIK